jgi:formylglycine-generating enzyme required for sulfatase activity
MVGNVWAWTEDCAYGNYNGAPTDGSALLEGGDCNRRVVRGGSWADTPDFLRSAARRGNAADSGFVTLGFRVGRTLSAGAGAITVAPGVR